MTPTPLDDLRWLLTSPSLLQPAALPATITLGSAAQGVQWLDQLDEDALRAALAHPPLAPPFRLGRYAEWLMQQALSHLPGHPLLASQLPVREAGRSLGEYDFLLRRPGQATLHLELAVKVYLAVEMPQGLRLVGPGLRDAFDLKLARLLQHQLRLAETPAGRLALPTGEVVQPMAWLRGWMFYRAPEDAQRIGGPLASDHLRGWWRRQGEPLPQQRSDSRWRSLPKRHWLASGLAEPDTPAFDTWQAEMHAHFAHHRQPLMVAEYAPPHEGGGELARGMILPDDWPDATMLAALDQRLTSLPARC